jgi:hypothetical protein
MTAVVFRNFRIGGDTPASRISPLVCHPEPSEGSAVVLSVTANAVATGYDAIDG